MSRTSYEKAYHELQEIVQELETEDVNIDQIQKKMKRAAELIKICKKKLRSTEEEINGLMEELESDEE